MERRRNPLFESEGTLEPKEDSEFKMAAVGVEESPEGDKGQEAAEMTLEKQLEAGALPEEFREAWKIVDPNSPEAQQFHNEAKSLAEVLYAPVKSEEHLPNYEFKHHDFEKEPIRFLLSKDKDPNAWFVRHSKPPIVVFSEGLFVPKKAGERALVTSQNDFAAILSHEMTHLKMRQVYGNIPNSKVEEGFAYSLPLVLMYEKGRQIGLNPERVIDKSGQAGVYNLMRTHLKKGESWGGYLDVHPSADNIHSIVSNTLAYLKKEKGKLEPDVPEVKPYSENEPLLKAIKESKFSTFVEQSLQQHPEYKDASCPQKVAVLESVLGSMGDKRWSTRTDDLVTEIRKLRPEVQTVEDRKAINEFANQALSLGDAGDLRNMQKIYSALGEVVSKRLEMPPLGRLRSIAKEAKALIETVNDYENNDQTVVAAAQALTQSLEGLPQQSGEPLLNTPNGRRFLQSIAWPQFKLPSEEAIRRARRSDEGGVEAPWEPLRELSERYPEVAKACVYLGLVRDPLIFEGVLRHEDIALKMAGARRGGAQAIFGTIPEISAGPKEGSDTMEGLRFNEDGLIVRRTTLMDREKKRGDAVDRYLDQWIEQEFSNALQNPGSQERLLKLVSRKRGYKLEEIVGLDICGRNFPLFLQVNETPLSTAEPAIRIFLKKLTEMGEPGKELFHKLFTLEPGRTTLLMSLENKPFIGYAELRNRAEEKKGGDIVTNSYFTSLLLDESVFTPQEKFALYEQYLVTEKFSYTVEPLSHFQVISGSFDEKQAAFYVSRLKPLFETLGQDHVLSPPTWQQLVASYRGAGDEAATLNLTRSCLYAEAIQLLAAKTPTIRQAANFIEMVPPDLLYNSRFQAQLQEKLQVRAKNFANKDVRSGKLPEVVRLWQILSKAEVIFPEMSDTILKTLAARVEQLDDGTKEGLDQSLAMSQRLLEGSHIQEPNIRKNLVTIWTTSMAGIHGTDSGTSEYTDNITATVDKLNVNRIDRAEVLQALARTLQSQNNLSRELQKRAYEVTTEAFTQNALHEIFTDAAVDAIRKSPEHRKATLDLLTTPLSGESCHAFLASGQDILEFVDKNNPVMQSFKVEVEAGDPREKNVSLAYRQQLALSGTRRFYENFWAAPIEARAVLTRELLVSPAEVLDTVDKETFDYAVAKVFTGNKEYEKESRFFLRAYIDALPHYQKHLCLGAVLAAAERQGTAELRLGETLAYFLENMGPAETKFGQAAQSHPLVPADIRQDLKRLKFHASEPARWEVTQWVEDIRTELQEQYQSGTGSTATIERIGDVIGSGSINVVAEVQMSDNKSYVLSLLRPNAEDRGHSGFETMRRMSDNLNLEDIHEMVQTTRELVDQANQRLGIEVNCQLAKQQYSNAKQLYAGTAVTVDNEDYQFDSADVVAAGNNFFLMSKVPGDHYIELPEKNAEQKLTKKRYAEAILTLELNNKLRGRFDPDRHGGNVKIEAGSRTIGHFDFKSMALNEWSEEGYRQFAEVLVGALNEDKTPEQFFNDLVEQERVLRDRLQTEGKTLDPFVTEVSKGLLTDGEYAQALDKKDLMRVVASALLNGMHPGMQRALLETIATRIPPWFKDQYTQEVEPVVRQSLETGELTPTLQQFLPVDISAADLIRIKRT